MLSSDARDHIKWFYADDGSTLRWYSNDIRYEVSIQQRRGNECGYDSGDGPESIISGTL